MCSKVDPVRDFLESVKDARFDQRRCELKLEQLDAQCTSMTAKITGVPGGGGDVHKDGPLASLAQARIDLKTAYLKAEQKEREVEDFINLLPDVRHRAVLTLYYVNLLKWPRVVEEMEKCGLYYSERHIFRLHGDALQQARILWADQHPGEGVCNNENRHSETENIQEMADR